MRIVFDKKLQLQYAYLQCHCAILRRWLFFSYCLALFLGSKSGMTQPIIQTPVSSQPVANLGFKQAFNSYIWTLTAGTRQEWKNWNVSFREGFRSSLLRLGTNNKWKDDQDASLDITYALLPKLDLFSHTRSVVFKDRQSGFNNDVQTHSNMVGLYWQPLAALQIQAAAGPKLDQRYEKRDAGWSFHLNGQTDRFDWQDYSHTIQMMMSGDQLGARQNKDVNFNYQVYKSFSPGTSDSLHVYTLQRRRDNYSSIFGEIESFRENYNGLNNYLSYRVNANTHFQFITLLLNKDVRVLSYGQESENRERHRTDLSVDNRMKLDLLWSGARLQSELSYWSQNQQYDLQVANSGLPFSRRTAFITPDNKSNRLLFSSRLDLSLGQSDSLHSYTSISRFQYDTPDTSNFDDRDELRINSTIHYFYRLSPYLKLELETSVNLYHIVYIFGERSADNNWNRILRLRPSVKYTYKDRFKLSQSVEVLANYVDYDFEEFISSTKSFVFRKFALDDSITWILSDRSTIHVDYRFQMEENGQLFWQDWSERLMLTRQSHWIKWFWRYRTNNGLSIAPGMTIYLRKAWRHQTDPSGIDKKTAFAEHKSYGPVFRILYHPYDRFKVVIDAIRQRVISNNLSEYYINTIHFNLQCAF